MPQFGISSPWMRAMEGALLLSWNTQKVTLVHRRTKFWASNKEAVWELRNMDHMELLLTYKVMQWITHDKIKDELTLRGVCVCVCAVAGTWHGIHQTNT